MLGKEDAIKLKVNAVMAAERGWWQSKLGSN